MSTHLTVGLKSGKKAQHTLDPNTDVGDIQWAVRTIYPDWATITLVVVREVDGEEEGE